MSGSKGRAGDNAKRPVIVRREDVVAGGSHGGSWKIAYADFMTAMMAFFLVMWLINATTEQQRRGIAAYFNPLAEQSEVTPSDGIMPDVPSPMARGQSTRDAAQVARSGAIIDNAHPTPSVADQLADKNSAALVPVAGSSRKLSGRLPRERMSAARQQVENALQSSSEWKQLRSQVIVSGNSDEIRIAIEDSDHVSMFDRGGITPNVHAITLLRALVPVLLAMPGSLIIGGYTDAAPYRTGARNNWTLSALRADAARDVLVQAGLPEWRILAVAGHGPRDLLDANNPTGAENRRIVIILSRDAAMSSEVADKR